MLLTVGLLTSLSVSGEVTPAERGKLRDYLTTMREQVVSEASGLSEAQWTFKSASDRWSVGEIVQHMTLSEPFIFAMHEKAMTEAAATAERRAAAQGRDDQIVKTIADRTKKVTAPEPLQPSSALAARDQGLAAFKAARAKTLEYVESAKGDFRAYVADSPLGPMDGYQVLLFLGAHNERHLAQLREVKADPKFPK